MKITVVTKDRNHLRGGLIKKCYVCGAPKYKFCEAYMDGQYDDQLSNGGDKNEQHS